jgi:hypothetical protein
VAGTVVPAVTNVRDTLVYDGGTKTGSLKVPATNKVLSPEPVDATTGTLTQPNTQYVLSTAADYGIGGTGGAKTATIPTDSNVATGTGAYGVNGTGSTPSYPTTATSQAAQLATDQGVVLAAAASIKDDATILSQAGSYDFTAAIAAGNAAGAATQLSTDQGEVSGNISKIKRGEIVLTGSSAGTYPINGIVKI